MAQICRTCFQETGERNYIELENDHQSFDIKAKIAFCIPEMDLLLSTNPVVCILCVNLLNSAYTFKKQCLETEHSIKKFLFGIEGLKGGINLRDIHLYSKNEDVYNVVVEDTTESNELEIVSDKNGVVDDLNHLLDDALSVQTPVTTPKVVEHSLKIEIEDDDDDDIIFLDDDIQDDVEDDLLVAKDSGDELQCDPSREENKIKAVINYPTNKKPRGRPRIGATVESKTISSFCCEYCDFRTKNFEILLKHVQSHHNKLKKECKPYFCPLCKKRAKWKCTIVNHMKIHNIFVSSSKNRKSSRKK